MARHSVSLNKQQEEFLEALFSYGIYGRTKSEFIRRILDERLATIAGAQNRERARDIEKKSS